MAIINMFLNAEDYFTFEEGQVIFQKGDASDFMYGIIAGTVEIRAGDKVLECIGPGSVFGEMALIEHAPRSATAIARTNCKVVQVDQPGFHKLIMENPSFALDVMRIMSERLRRFIDLESRSPFIH